MDGRPQCSKESVKDNFALKFTFRSVSSSLNFYPEKSFNRQRILISQGDCKSEGSVKSQGQVNAFRADVRVRLYTKIRLRFRVDRVDN